MSNKADPLPRAIKTFREGQYIPVVHHSVVLFAYDEQLYKYEYCTPSEDRGHISGLSVQASDTPVTSTWGTTIYLYLAPGGIILQVRIIRIGGVTFKILARSW